MLRPADDKHLSTSGLIAAAAAYAAAELFVTVVAGGFFTWGRAEPLLFLALRPWLLLLAAALVARYRVRDRLLFYVLALALAALCETLLLFGLGGREPWGQTLRGLAAGAVLLAVVDVVLQLAQRLIGRWGRPAATVGLALLLLTPTGLRGYEAIIFDRERSAASQRPDLMLMTALPLVWGEKGAFDPGSPPAAAYKALQREFIVQPLDVLDPASLAGGRLLLLAQPRALAPGELVALDDWVRKGGRALILSDPLLVWPSELPLGDTRRPPPVGLLAPLLTHWGIDMEPAERKLVVDDRRRGETRRRLAMAAAGAIVSRNPQCRVEEARYLARCRIGEGQAILIADADLLQDSLWAAPGENGDRRDHRLSDNSLVVADLLDELGGGPRGRVDGNVEWAAQDASRTTASFMAMAPLLLALALAAFLRLRRKP